MATKTLRIGSMAGIQIYDDGDFDCAIETDHTIKVGTAPSGADEVLRYQDVEDGAIDGDHVDIDWNPTNYTPDATIAEAADVDDLSAHLKGIDTALVNLASGASGNVTVITAIQVGGAGAIGFQYKDRQLTVTGGVITTIGAESGWNDI